jgi:prophage maintenance system killer protein
MRNDIGKGRIVIYKTPEGKTDIEVKLEKETIWLNLNQIAKLFERDKSVVSRHLSSIFKESELDKVATVAKIATVQMEGDRSISREIEYYNLDVIISVGYRVNSKRATEFRIWATQLLKNYLVQGYAINQKRLQEQQEKFKELQQTLNFLKEKGPALELKTQAGELLSIISQYANSLSLLFQYDEGIIPTYKTKKPGFALSYETSKQLIDELRLNLSEKGEATHLFGKEINHQFEGIINAIYQTFDAKDLYESIEEKVANLLYLAIKDHPFIDGNKRIGSLLFIYFLKKNNFLWKENGERKITDTTLVALSLLIAISSPKEKDIMVNIITNLLKG